MWCSSYHQWDHVTFQNQQSVCTCVIKYCMAGDHYGAECGGEIDKLWLENLNQPVNSGLVISISVTSGDPDDSLAHSQYD